MSHYRVVVSTAHDFVVSPFTSLTDASTLAADLFETAHVRAVRVEQLSCEGWRTVYSIRRGERAEVVR